MDRVTYRTTAGSTVRPIRKSSWEINFDWFEEGACCEAYPEVDESRRVLQWGCACCDDSSAGEVALTPAESNKETKMHPNSQAYKDAWARIRKAIAKEAELWEIPISDAALDDMACKAAHAAFGMDDDEAERT